MPIKSLTPKTQITTRLSIQFIADLSNARIDYMAKTRETISQPKFLALILDHWNKTKGDTK